MKQYLKYGGKNYEKSIIKGVSCDNGSEYDDRYTLDKLQNRTTKTI